MENRFAYINGEILPLAEAVVGIGDRGFLHGDGVFETIRVSGGKPLRLARHLERLRAGIRLLRLSESLLGVDFGAAIESVLDANGLPNARVRLTVTRGASEGPGKLIAGGGTPTVVITADPLPASLPQPARVIFSSIRRDEQNPLSAVKSLNYLPAILARIEAEEAGADDVILLNTQGLVCEGTIGNLFLLKGKRLVTPSLDQGPLPGTARAALIDLAPEIGLEVVERPVKPNELAEADELFFTNAIRLAWPIPHLDGNPIGRGGQEVCRMATKALE